jgi:transcriptional regulator with XRE-family HTH domain
MRNLSDFELKKIENDIPIKVGEQIVYYRKLKGLTQTELAKIVNKDRQYIYKIEKAVVTSNIATLAIIATALEISLSQLFEKVK